MYETLLSRFADDSVLASPAHHVAFEGCLRGLAADPRAAELMASPAPDDFWFPSDDWRSAYRPYSVQNGVLHIPVRGVLLSKFPWQVGGYATGYTYIRKAYERGMDDPDVGGIAFVIHSPGGEVAECFDAVDKMVARRDEKPVRAFATEFAYSAAYAVASVAPSIVVSRTGGVGSVGVVTSHLDVSKMLDQMGWKITFISAPEDGFKTEGNSVEPLSKEARARIQARINDLYELFVATTAANRGMAPDDVRSTKALCFSARDAVARGLADAVAPFEDAIAEFSAEIVGTQGETAMSDVKKEEHERLVAQARADGVSEGKAQGATEAMARGKAEGAKVERERISAILASDEGKARPKAALSAALKTDMGVDAAKGFLADLDEEKPSAGTPGKSGQDFSAAMRKEGAKVEAGAGDDEGDDKGEDASSAVSALKLAADFGLRGFGRKS